MCRTLHQCPRSLEALLPPHLQPCHCRSLQVHLPWCIKNLLQRPPNDWLLKPLDCCGGLFPSHHPSIAGLGYWSFACKWSSLSNHSVVLWIFDVATNCFLGHGQTSSHGQQQSGQPSSSGTRYKDLCQIQNCQEVMGRILQFLNWLYGSNLLP